MPVMSFMRQELPDSVLNETQSWVRQSSQRNPPQSPTSGLIYFCSFFILHCVSCMFVLLTQQLAQVDNFQIVSFNKMLQLLCASRCFPHPKGGRGAISPQQEQLRVIYGCCTSANRGPGLFAVPEFVLQKRENARKGMKPQGEKKKYFSSFCLWSTQMESAVSASSKITSCCGFFKKTKHQLTVNNSIPM